MARIDFGGVEESDGQGLYGDVPNGTYVLRIDGIEYQDGEEYALVTWDVAEGPHAGQYAGRPAWAHQERMYFSGGSLGYLKHKLRVLSESNPGFDAMAAFNAAIDPSDPHHDRALAAFAGKLVGASVRLYLWRMQTGADGSRAEIGAWWTADEARQGTHDGRPIPTLADRYKRGYSPAQSQAADAGAVEVAEDDIPF